MASTSARQSHCSEVSVQTPSLTPTIASANGSRNSIIADSQRAETRTNNIIKEDQIYCDRLVNDLRKAGLDENFIAQISNDIIADPQKNEPYKRNENSEPLGIESRRKNTENAEPSTADDIALRELGALMNGVPDTITTAVTNAGSKEMAALDPKKAHLIHDSRLVNPRRPVYTRFSRKDISQKTLAKYRLPYEFDQEDSDYLIIPRYIPECEQEYLFNDTVKVRREQWETAFQGLGPSLSKGCHDFEPQQIDLVLLEAAETKLQHDENPSRERGFSSHPDREKRGPIRQKSPTGGKFRRENALRDFILKPGGHPPMNNPRPASIITDDNYDIAFGTRATIVDFIPGEKLFHNWSRPFVKDLLFGSGPEAIMSDSKATSDEGIIRWIHLPANNMSWIESLMAKIYEGRAPKGNEPPLYNQYRGELITDRRRWLGLQHHALANQAHARFMRPYCSKFSLDSSFMEAPDPDYNMVLYMPYLSWEYTKAQNEMAGVIKDVLSGVETRDPAVIVGTDCCRDEKLIRAYLNAKRPLHIRRTLDQSYYHTLEDTSIRDNDQVVSRHTSKTSSSDPLLMMVDQLWLWVLDGDTIVTSFPHRWDKPQYNRPSLGDLDILECLLRRFSDPSDPVHSAYDLAFIILEQILSIFFDQVESQFKELQFFEFFAHAIGAVSQKQIEEYERFWKTIDHVHKWEGSEAESSEKAILALKILHKQIGDIDQEILLQKEIKDVLEELHMIQQIHRQQGKVLAELIRDLEGLPNRCFALSETIDQDLQKPRLLQKARELQRTIVIRSEEIKEMEGEALKVDSALSGLVDLKLKYANVQEARSARIVAEESAEQTKEATRQTEEAISQGRTILLFTIVTIIFLPLSFIASIFGMNAKEINGGATGSSISLGVIFAYMFPISVVFIFLALALGFHNHFSHGLQRMIEITKNVRQARYRNSLKEISNNDPSASSILKFRERIEKDIEKTTHEGLRPKWTHLPLHRTSSPLPTFAPRPQAQRRRPSASMQEPLSSFMI